MFPMTHHTLKSFVRCTDKQRLLLSLHTSDCELRLAIECSTPVECQHGYDVCPHCDQCTCCVGGHGDDDRCEHCGKLPGYYNESEIPYKSIHHNFQRLRWDEKVPKVCASCNGPHTMYGSSEGDYKSYVKVFCSRCEHLYECVVTNPLEKMLKRVADSFHWISYMIDGIEVKQTYDILYSLIYWGTKALGDDTYVRFSLLELDDTEERKVENENDDAETRFSLRELD